MSGLGKNETNLVGPTCTTVGCVQFGTRRRERPEEFSGRVVENVTLAAESGAELVVFPAYTGLAYLAAACPRTRLFLGPGLGAAVTRAFASCGRGILAEFVGVFAEAARKHGVYVATGTTPVPTAGGVRNVVYLLSPEGKTLGEQAQTHLSRDERASGFVASPDLRVFHTPIGVIGFAVCEDAWYPEVARILALQGAQIVLAPVAVPRPYSEWHQVRGMWQSVQQNQVFGVEACLVGILGGVDFEGRSAMYATCEMTEGDTGVLRRARRTGGEEVLVSRLSFGALQATIDGFPVFEHFNKDLYGRWLPHVYRDYVAAHADPRSAPALGTAGQAAQGGPADAPPPRGRAFAFSRDSVRLWALKALLHVASRPTAVRSILARKGITPSRACLSLSAGRRPSKVRVAAVQMRLDLAKDARAYVERVYALTQAAVRKGAQLVVFPEGSGAPLVGLVPGVERVAAKGVDAAVAQMAGAGLGVAAVLRAVSPATRRIYETAFSTLAKAFRVFIIAGSAFLEDDDGEMRIISYFYDPEGRAIARQRKLHLTPLEAKWGLCAGADLEVLDTPLGRIAFPICMDATYFETFRIARLRGAEIVAVPSANDEEYMFWRTMRGIWPRVQESQVFGVSAAAVGSLLGITFTGRSGLLAPLEMTASGDGVLVQARTFDDEEVVVGDLDLDALHRFREENPLRFNAVLYEKHLPAAYGRVAGRPRILRPPAAT